MLKLLKVKVSGLQKMPFGGPSRAGEEDNTLVR